jgi:hypothetical protein
MTTVPITDSTIAIAFNQTPSTNCAGFFDADKTWNNG